MFQIQKKKQKESKFKQLNKLWEEVSGKADKRRGEMKSVFVMIAKDFERWEQMMLKRLDSGELVTSDILVFEEKLQVCRHIHLTTVVRRGSGRQREVVALGRWSFKGGGRSHT